MSKIRLNKYLAQAGAASRRGADQLIKEGKVKVNGTLVTELGKTINPENDTVSLDGINLKSIDKYTYIMLNKPKGCITTVKDDLGRKTVFDYLNDIEVPHLFPVGRLDYDTEGLLILTNDGDLAYKLTHPSREVPKTYSVKVKGEVPEHKLAQLRKGVEIDGIKTMRSKVKLIEFKLGISRIEITISEGRNRQVRKMFEAVGCEVEFLKRIAVGELRLGGLSRGGHRYLTEYEIDYLKNF